MKNYKSTISLVAALALASANGLAQTGTPAPQPRTPAPPAVPRAVIIPAQDEVEALAATEAALAAQDTALQAQNEALDKVNERLLRVAPRAARASTSTRSLVIPKDSADAKNVNETRKT